MNVFVSSTNNEEESKPTKDLGVGTLLYSPIIYKFVFFLNISKIFNIRFCIYQI